MGWTAREERYRQRRGWRSKLCNASDGSGRAHFSGSICKPSICDLPLGEPNLSAQLPARLSPSSTPRISGGSRLGTHLSTLCADASLYIITSFHYVAQFYPPLNSLIRALVEPSPRDEAMIGDAAQGQHIGSLPDAPPKTNPMEEERNRRKTISFKVTHILLTLFILWLT